MKNFTVNDITKISIMAALIFIATYFIKIPSINGYSHLGDSMILISVLMLGGRKGAFASAVGASFADIIGGYMQWAVPTFFIKFMLALIMGAFISKIMPKAKLNWLVGAVCGGIFQIFAYTAVKILYYGFAQAMVMTPGLLVQTSASIIITAVFVGALKSSGFFNKFACSTARRKQ
ncbi:ECF transporter S component [Anaerotignum faecicola]|nr:ECF transporter S component [Anaerotignum faecicola]